MRHDAKLRNIYDKAIFQDIKIQAKFLARLKNLHNYFGIFHYMQYLCTQIYPKFYTNMNANMKTVFITIALCLYCIVGKAQTNKPFIGTFNNNEYNIYLKLNLYDKNIIVPQQEIFGEVDGFVGDYKDSRKWLITGSKINKDNTATISIINDYGSEDLTAILTLTNDTTIQLTQKDGSTIKIARNRKWVKLPSKLYFIRKR